MKDIIVIEDGRQEREWLSDLFTQAGYQVTACEGATEAEHALKLDRYRLAFIDIGLNDRSGSLLFHDLKRSGESTILVILTGNPSVHLKKRFIEEGAADYIVKASPAARGPALLARVGELIGAPASITDSGIPLEEFLSRYVTPSSRALFLDRSDKIPKCRCGACAFRVKFDHKTQLPPELFGVVVCELCGAEMSGEI